MTAFRSPRRDARRSPGPAHFPAATVTRIAELLLNSPPRAGATRVLAIDGRSGSGKTTLASQVTTLMGAAGGVLHLDDVYPGWNGLLPAVPLLVEGVLRPLAEGHTPRIRKWDWGRDDWWKNPAREYRDVPTGEVLVVEGIGSGALACAPYLSALVWIEAPEELRYERAMMRDGEYYRPHWARWAAQEDVYLAANDPAARAGVIVTPQEPGVG